MQREMSPIARRGGRLDEEGGRRSHNNTVRWRGQAIGMAGLKKERTPDNAGPHLRGPATVFLLADLSPQPR
jgi:hypothetical protein